MRSQEDATAVTALEGCASEACRPLPLGLHASHPHGIPSPTPPQVLDNIHVATVLNHEHQHEMAQMAAGLIAEHDSPYKASTS